MGKKVFHKEGRKTKLTVKSQAGTPDRSVAEIVRELKASSRGSHEENYRERSLAIHGLVCAHCGREFEQSNRHLLTVHHKDGNHHNNPPDGSNWENLCIYCHENAHSRDVLGEYYNGEAQLQERAVVFDGESQEGSNPGFSVLEKKLKDALKKMK